MPTGYTADIKDGITFPKFAMNCARAFGATVTMRDESMSVAIPEEFKPNTEYYDRSLKKAHQFLAFLNKVDNTLAEKMAQKEYLKEKIRIGEHLAESNDTICKYRVMLSKVNNWQPPTKDHEELKKFMIDQLEQSIKFDDMSRYYRDNPAILLNGQSWILKKKQECLRDIAYHTKERTEEISRTLERNKWIKDLRNSLEDSKVNV